MRLSTIGRYLTVLSLSACSVDDRQVATATGLESAQVEPRAEGTAGSGGTAPAQLAAPAASPASAPAEPLDASGSAPSGEPAGAGTEQMSAAEVQLSVAMLGDGAGSIQVSVEGGRSFDCGQVGCSVPVPQGSRVSVSATPQPYSVVQRWSEPACGAEPTCTLTVSGETVLRGEFQLKHQVAFVTSSTYLPSQLPRAGEVANTECTRLAKASGFHGNRWVAWLSSSNGTTDTGDDVHAIDQLQHTGGWVRPDGMPVARSLAALARGEVIAPIQLSARRTPAPFAAWTNTSVSGRLQRPETDCSGWTSDDGSALGLVVWSEGIGVHWQGLFVEGCNEPQAMLCLGDDSDEEVQLPSLPGRLVFVSEAQFRPGGGVAAADALCQREACAAGLTGGDCELAPGTQRTFLSYLHTSTRRAWERFDLSGPSWVRPDGLQWLAAAADLARDAADALVPPGVLLGPRYGIGPDALWVGEAAGTSTCDDWTGSSGSGALAPYDTRSPNGLGNLLVPGGYVSVQSCAEPLPVLCLEQ